LYPQAIGDLSEAILRNPKAAEYFRLRAKAYAMVGDEQKYKEDTEKAKDLGGKR
jgi:hypothetical protein